MAKIKPINDLTKLEALAALKVVAPASEKKRASAEIPKMIPFVLNEKREVIKDVRNYVIYIETAFPEKIRFNTFTKKYDVFGSLPWDQNGDIIRRWTDTDTNNFLLYTSEYGLKDIKSLQYAIDIVAHRNSYNPLIDFLDSLEYKGDGYIRKLLPDYLGCEDSEYTYHCLRTFMLGMVTRAYHPGVKFDLIIVLVGGQGTYKSSFLRILARNDAWFSDSLDCLNDRKRVGEAIQGIWLVELAEVAAFRRSETESVKSVITSQCDSYREAYGHFRVDYPRITCFAGTTNEKTFLKDATGNRRFLILPVNPTRRKKDLFSCPDRDDDFNAAWAEAVHIVKQAEKAGKTIPLVLPKEVLAEAVAKQQGANEVEEWAGMIIPWLDELVSEPKPRYRTSALDVWCNCFRKTEASFSQREARRINGILNGLKEWESVSKVEIRLSRRSEYGEEYVYFNYRGRGYRYVNHNEV